MQASLLIVIGGVSGVGKSRLAELLAARLHAGFLEGDSLHPAANIAKMTAGIALDDADRQPWLAGIGARLERARVAHERLVVTCSMLKRSYRDQLQACAQGKLHLILLTAPYAVLLQRVEQRQGHFMPSSLLDSQLATLEMPRSDEGVMIVDASGSIEQTVDALAAAVRSTSGAS